MKKLVITGGSGFLGSNLIASLKSKYKLCVGFRGPPPDIDEFDCFPFELGVQSDYDKFLDGADCVIHTAAAVHLNYYQRKYSKAEIFETNCEGTLHLAQQAAKAGVKRFIFISTVGVNGGCSELCFTELDTPSPRDNYSLSKYKAEKGLWSISKRTGLEVVVIRPPMIYGLGAPGNFAKIIKARPFWRMLPIGGIHNKRSFIYVGNLVDFIDLCITHPKAGNELFLISDGDSVSTSQFFTTLFEVSGKKINMIEFPEMLARCIFLRFWAQKFWNSLYRSASIDCSKAKKKLGWRAPHTFNDGMLRSVQSGDVSNLS